MPILYKILLSTYGFVFTGIRGFEWTSNRRLLVNKDKRHNVFMNNYFIHSNIIKRYSISISTYN